MLRIFDWSKLDSVQKQIIIERSSIDIEAIKDYVSDWIAIIKNEGDAGIIKYIKKFDNPDFKISKLKVSADEIAKAYKSVDTNIIEVIKKQISISRENAEYKMSLLDKYSLREVIKGVRTGFKLTPIESTGLLVPAGEVPLPTVMQILGVNAKAAGVERIVACFPPTGEYPEMLIAADLSGVTDIYRVGGIAGVAALAYGTETIKPVLKIVGPGSKYTQAAKSLVSSKVGIDMIAGPSEAIILADETANPIYCAADILARAEHSPDAAGVLVTNSKKLAQATALEITKQIKNLTRNEVIKKSLEKYSCALVFNTINEAIDFTNDYSPEHIEIMTKLPEVTVNLIKNAGSIFVGEYAPVAVGDYASGTSHTLPTGFWPKVASPVSVETFLKRSEIQILTKNGLSELSEIVKVISEIEGLDAHWNSVNVRL